MNNRGYGKTIQNLRKRIKVRFVNNAKVYTKSTSKRRFFSQKIFNKHFVDIHEIKLVLALHKPIYTGFSMLDLSQLLMYKFHYNEIKTSDVYEDFYEDKNLFDFSDYQQNTKFFDPVNKNAIGKMKQEFKGNITSEFAR